MSSELENLTGPAVPFDVAQQRVATTSFWAMVLAALLGLAFAALVDQSPPRPSEYLQYETPVLAAMVGALPHSLLLLATMLAAATCIGARRRAAKLDERAATIYAYQELLKASPPEEQAAIREALARALSPVN